MAVGVNEGEENAALFLRLELQTAPAREPQLG